MHCLLKVCVEISDSFPPCQDHSSIDGSYGLQRFLVTDTVSSSFKWATLTLGCHLDFVLEEASTSPPSPLGVIPSLGSSHSSPVYWESKQCFPKPKGRVFLFFLGGGPPRLSSLCCPPSCLLLSNVQKRQGRSIAKKTILATLEGVHLARRPVPQRTEGPYCCFVPLWWRPIAWQRSDSSSFPM